MSKLKLMTIIGTRPEIIRLAAVIKKCDKYFDQILVHTGQNYDYELNQVFFDDLGLRAPDFYLDAVGKDLGETITLAIYEEQEVVQPLDPKFVGASGGGAIFYNTGDGVNEYIYTDKNCTVKATKEDVVKVMYSPIFIEFTGGSDGTTTLDRVVSIFLNQAGSASLATVYRSSDGLTLSYYYTAEHSDGPA